MGAGLASGAAIEKFRQYLGDKIANQKEDDLNVGIAGGLGVLSPMLFGNQASTKAIAKEAIKRGTPEKVFEKTQQGLLGKAYDKIAPKISSLFISADEPEIAWMKNNLHKIKEWEKNPTAYAQQLMKDRDMIVDATKSVAQQAGQNIEKTVSQLDQSGVRLSVDEIMRPIDELKDRLSQMAKKEKVPQSILDELLALEQEVAQELSAKSKGLRLDPNTMVLSEQETTERLKDVSPILARKIKDNLNSVQRRYGLDISKFENIEGAGRAGATKSSKDIAAAFGKAAGQIEDQIEKSASAFKIVDEGQEIPLSQFYRKNKEIYGSIQDVEDEIKTSTRGNFSLDRFRTFLEKFKKPENILLKKEIEQMTNQNLGELGTSARAFGIFGRIKDPSLKLPEQQNLARPALSSALGYGAASALSGGGFVPLAAGTALGYGASRPLSHRLGFQMGNLLQKAPSYKSTGFGTTPFGIGNTMLQKQMLPWSLLNEEETK
jgi:hypothetical protein